MKVTDCDEHVSLQHDVKFCSGGLRLAEYFKVENEKSLRRTWKKFTVYNEENGVQLKSAIYTEED